MVKPDQFYRYIITPALRALDLYSTAAAQLLLGTAITESRLEYLDQVESNKGDKVPGPAYGFFQMEMFTHDDIWKNYIVHKPLLMASIRKLMCKEMPLDEQLHGNAFYAAAMCRVHYLRIPKAMPPEGQAAALAGYWKQYYNTPLGAGSVEKALPAFQQAIAIIK